jgi:thymidine phosphorylase
VFANEKDAPQDLSKSLLLSASIIDMVHGTKQKWITTCKGNSFHRENMLKNSLLYAKRKVVLEPEYAIYKEDVIAEKSGVVTEIDNRRLAKLTSTGVSHDKSRVLLKL